MMTTARELAVRRSGERGPLLEVLHDVMRTQGWIGEGDIQQIAEVLNLSVAEVHGVVTFYDDFRTSPPPTHTIRVCRAEACQAVGAEEVHRSLQAQLADRQDVEVRQVFCLGNCALGPSAQIDGELQARVSAEKIMDVTRGWQS